MILSRSVLSSSLITAILFLCHTGTAYAQDTSARVISKYPTDEYRVITDEDLQFVRKDIRSQRKQIIAMNMKLTEAEAEKFWPVYERYISDMAKLDDTKYELLVQYVRTRGALTDREAESAVKEWPEIDQKLAQLNMQYIPVFRKILSSKNTALFYQLDRHLQLLIDLQLASQLPLIEP